MKGTLIFTSIMALIGFLIGRQIAFSHRQVVAPQSQEWRSLLSGQTGQTKSAIDDDFSVVLDALTNQENNHDSDAFARFVRAQAKINLAPQAILQLSPEERNKLDVNDLADALTEAAQVDPDKVLAIASSHSHWHVRTAATGAALQAIGAKDPVRGHELVRQHVQDLGWPPSFLLEDLEKAKELHAELPVSALRRNLTTRIAEAWAAEDPKSALMWTTDQANETHIAKLVLQSWLKSDLHAAGAALKSMTPLPQFASTRQELVKEVLTHHGYQAALEWTDRYLPPNAHKAAKAVALEHLASKDPARAMALAIEWDAMPTQVLDAWVKTEPATALTWASDLADVGLSEELVQSGVRTWSAEDPASAASQVSLWASDGQTVPDETIRIVGHHWLIEDPASAVSWLGQWPDASQASKLLERLVRQVQRKSLHEVARSIAALPSDRITPAIQEELIRKTSRYEGEEAAETLRSMFGNTLGDQ